MKENIIGREFECDRLQKALETKKSQLIIIYGRRRVGKTFLVNQFFNEQFAFKVTGVFNKPKEVQLQVFTKSLENYFNSQFDIPSNWIDAFNVLRNNLGKLPKNKKMVVFFDEMPWMDTQKSDFLAAFEWFWNDWGCTQDNLIFIVCGSAASWLVKNIDHNKGGMFNRQNCKLYLEPFNLNQTKQFLKSKNIDWADYDIAMCYMIMGGIPYYLDLLTNDYSLNQNIDNLFFKKHGFLWDEFSHLYNTLFSNSETHIKIVEALSEKRIGLSKKEIAEKTHLSQNGRLTEMLSNLVSSGFVREYHFYGNNKKQHLFQLSDYYTMFYFKFIKNQKGIDENFWTNSTRTSSINAWSGFTFEQLCKDHLKQIKQKLGISGVLTTESSWFVHGDDEHEGAQIDMLLDRRDHIINVCEMKFSNDEYEIDKKYDLTLKRKINRFREVTKTNKTLLLTMITTYGVKKNMYSNIVQSQVTLKDLFREE